MLNLDVATSTPLGRRLQRFLPNSTTSFCFFAAYILEQQTNPDSPWSPWLGIVPRAFPSLPIRYTQAQWALLQGNVVEGEVAEHRERYQAEYAAVKEAVADFSFTYAAYETARLVVTTPLFSYTNGRGERAFALVPMADMLNHAARPRSNVQWMCNAHEERFDMSATADILPHHPLLTSYGGERSRTAPPAVLSPLSSHPLPLCCMSRVGHCNSVLFAHYGLVLLHNDHNRAALTFPNVDPTAAARSFTVLPTLDDTTSRMMLLHVRRLALTELSSPLSSAASTALTSGHWDGRRRWRMRRLGWRGKRTGWGRRVWL